MKADFYVMHDLRTDVFMAYETALYIPRAMTLLLVIIDRCVRSVISDLIITYSNSSFPLHKACVSMYDPVR